MCRYYFNGEELLCEDIFVFKLLGIGFRKKVGFFRMKEEKDLKIYLVLER